MHERMVRAGRFLAPWIAVGLIACTPDTSETSLSQSPQSAAYKYRVAVQFKGMPGIRPPIIYFYTNHQPAQMVVDGQNWVEMNNVFCPTENLEPDLRVYAERLGCPFIAERLTVNTGGQIIVTPQKSN